MKKILSYVLWGSSGRYWNNIPYLLIANSYVYPDFITRIYVHKNSTGRSYFKSLHLFNNVEVVVIDMPYMGTKLTTVRMIPLWEDDVEYLFCRDLDYALHSMEVKCVRHFINQSECTIHNIRGCGSHRLPLMAGLCGFKVKEVSVKHLAPTFDDYLKWGYKNVKGCQKWQWECDQFLLRDFFKSLYGSILDCPQGDAWKRLENISAKQCLPSQYENASVPDCKVLDEIFETKTIKWTAKWDVKPNFLGRRWVCTEDDLHKLAAAVDNDTSKKVMELYR